jgi:putative molybdopterin biosynthesis protein
LKDVARLGLRFAARSPATGTQRLTERLLRESGEEPRSLKTVGPYPSHLAVVLAVRSGRADVGLTIRIAAELGGLAFVPLHQERFQLAVPAPYFGHPALAGFLERLLDWFKKARDRNAPGYSFDHLGTLSLFRQPCA